MSDYNVALAPGAESDIADAFLWYRERNALAADSFRIEVQDAIGAIAAAPLARPADQDGNRMRVLHRFPREAGHVRSPVPQRSPALQP